MLNVESIITKREVSEKRTAKDEFIIIIVKATLHLEN